MIAPLNQIDAAYIAGPQRQAHSSSSHIRPERPQYIAFVEVPPHLGQGYVFSIASSEFQF